MIKLLNYANNSYRTAQRVNSWSGKYIARFDQVLSFGPQDIAPEFAEKNRNILSYHRGNGLWLWKPYFINRVIEESEDGDYVFYLDSGAFFMRDVRLLLPYISQDEPMFVTDIPLMECNWTKPSCIEYFHAERFRYTNQIQGGIVFFMVNSFTKKFFREYLEMCQTNQLILPEGLGKDDVIDRNYRDQFVSHREDQSIFSIMCKTEGLRPHRDLTQRGKNPRSFFNPNYLYQEPQHPDDHYPTMVFLHKAPNPFNPIVWARFIKNSILR